MKSVHDSRYKMILMKHPHGNRAAKLFAHHQLVNWCQLGLLAIAKIVGLKQNMKQPVTIQFRYKK